MVRLRSGLLQQLQNTLACNCLHRTVYSQSYIFWQNQHEQGSCLFPKDIQVYSHLWVRILLSRHIQVPYYPEWPYPAHSACCSFPRRTLQTCQPLPSFSIFQLPYHMPIPEVVGVELVGELREGSTPTDV